MVEKEIDEVDSSKQNKSSNSLGWVIFKSVIVLIIGILILIFISRLK